MQLESHFPDISPVINEKNRNTEPEEIKKDEHRFVNSFDTMLRDITDEERAQVNRVKLMEHRLIKKEQEKPLLPIEKNDEDSQAAEDNNFDMGPNIKDILKVNETVNRKKQGLKAKEVEVPRDRSKQYQNKKFFLRLIQTFHQINFYNLLIDHEEEKDEQ